MDIDKTLEMGQLIDCYGKLLTKKQQELLQLYFFNNLSFAEIASSNNTTRQAVYDLISRTTKVLQNYEKNLKLLEKKQKINKVLAGSPLTEKINKILEE